MKLNHYTIDSKDLVVQKREYIADDVIEWLKPYAKEGAHSFGELVSNYKDWEFLILKDNKSWIFQIYKKDKEEIINCLLSIDKDDEALLNFKGLNPSLDYSNLPSMPYLLVSFTSNHKEVIAAKEDMLWIGDFERCLAYAILELNKINPLKSGQNNDL